MAALRLPPLGIPTHAVQPKQVISLPYLWLLNRFVSDFPGVAKARERKDDFPHGPVNVYT